MMIHRDMRTPLHLISSFLLSKYTHVSFFSPYLSFLPPFYSVFQLFAVFFLFFFFFVCGLGSHIPDDTSWKCLWSITACQYNQLRTMKFENSWKHPALSLWCSKQRPNEKCSFTASYLNMDQEHFISIVIRIHVKPKICIEAFSYNIPLLITKPDSARVASPTSFNHHKIARNCETFLHRREKVIPLARVHWCRRSRHHYHMHCTCCIYIAFTSACTFLYQFTMYTGLPIKWWSNNQAN